MESQSPDTSPRRSLTPHELYRSAMRMRLTRAGLVKIMQENERRENQREAPCGPSDGGAKL